MSLDAPLRVACLTPAAAGGIAVIQIIGPDAARRLAPLLVCKTAVDWLHPDPDRLYLCQLASDQQILDDVVVAIRPAPNGEQIIDLNLHGGVRLVQRALMLLQGLGAQLVEPSQLLNETCAAQDLFAQEFLSALIQARTRQVARWLMRMKRELPEQIDALTRQLAAGQTEGVVAWLTAACDRAARLGYVLQGVRVVLIGAPNAGKSTLTNSLAERDAAIVHSLPGTTRDWTEHAGAIEGLPISYIDTAGLRETADPIEQDAIRRASEQAAKAHIVLQVMDASVAAGNFSEPQTRSCIVVWNKCDLPVHRDNAPHLASPAGRGIAVSATTGEGMNRLRERILDALGLAGWQDWPTTPFSLRQADACHHALLVLAAGQSQAPTAARWLQSVISVAPTSHSRVDRAVKL